MPEAPQAKHHHHPTRGRAGDATSAASPAHDGTGPARNTVATSPSPPDSPSPLPDYAELHCLSNFSFLRGASHPEELVAQAAELGYAALAITDENSLAGVVRAHVAAREHKLHLIIGARLTPRDAPPIVLLAPDRAAYGRLCRLITLGRRRAIKGQCELYRHDIVESAGGLLGIVLPDEGVTRDGPTPAFVSACRAYQAALGPAALFLAAELRYDCPDEQRLRELVALAQPLDLPLVATNAVHYHVPQRRYLQDVLTCIRQKCTIPEAGLRLHANAERHLRSRLEIGRRYGHHRDPGVRRLVQAAVTRTVQIAQRCRFSLDELRYDYPHELVPPELTAMAYLEQLTWAGAAERYPAPPGHAGPAGPRLPANVVALLRAELALIAELRYEHYFLTVWDLVRFARGRGILCQGRGSAANSAVCYCLGITAVDPARIDLLFERFISRERNEPPDIDVDFEHERREEVFQYIYEKYGRERAAITAEVITYRPRSAIRDVGKALGLSLDCVDALAKQVEWFDEKGLPEHALAAVGLNPQDRTIQMVVRLVKQLLGFPRHLSQHVGGFVITESPLCELVPLENGAMPGRTFIEWDKDDIDALGILKVDCLALGMLTALRKAFNLLAVSLPPLSCSPFPVPCSLLDIPPEDPAVYDMICAADTVGVFQIESRAQMSMLPRLKPRHFYDLVIEVAIVRPGPIQGGMVHPYLRRRDGLEPVSYPGEAIRGVLAKTLGVPLFQEQVMRLAVVAAGFTPGEADQLRRAMAAWRRGGQIEKFQRKLIEGMLRNGYAREFAEAGYKQIRGFGEYGFPESHAASFALLVYASAWLKRYYPAAFCAALINAQPMGFYTPGQLVRDAIAHGVTVLPVDVNTSAWDCTLEPGADHAGTGAEDSGAPPQGAPRAAPAVRLGFRLIRGLSEAKVAGVLALRRAGPIRTLAQLHRRPDVSRDTLLRLAAADAFRALGLGRRQALWQILALDDREPPLLAGLEPEVPLPALPELPLDEVVEQDYDALGLSLNSHPLALVRPELDQLKVTPNGRLRGLRSGMRVTVAGLVTVRQRPSTAKGTVFMTLEDETAMANLVIWPKIWERDRRIATGRIALLAEGRIERQGAVIHVMVQRLHDLSGRLGALRHTSRDFR